MTGREKSKIFILKQKTAYEMRISDWSSDVCSSDLRLEGGADRRRVRLFCVRFGWGADRHARHRLDGDRGAAPVSTVRTRCDRDRRNTKSEEHTSELQSLMRISYAVFCLKKQKKQ